MPEPIDYRSPAASRQTARHALWMRRGKAAMGVGAALWVASWVWFETDPNVSRYPTGPVGVALGGIALAVAGIVAYMVGMMMKAR